MVRVFANGPGERGLILGRVIPKTQKMVIDASLLNTQNYKVWINGTWSNPGRVVAPSPTPRCSSYWKRSLLVVLDYGQPTYIRHSWYNGYCRRKWTRRSEFKSVCISQSANTLWKGVHHTVLWKDTAEIATPPHCTIGEGSKKSGHLR